MYTLVLWSSTLRRGSLRSAHCSFMMEATGSKGIPQQSKGCHLAANEGDRAKQFILASLRVLTSSSNTKLGWAQDKAQFVFTSLHGGINIAAASVSFHSPSPVPLISPSSVVPQLPKRTTYQHSMPYQNIYLPVLAEYKRPFS